MPENIEPIPSNKAKDIKITDAGNYYPLPKNVETALQFVWTSSGFVPYSGAITDVNLGTHSLSTTGTGTTSGYLISGGTHTDGKFLRADGTNCKLSTLILPNSATQYYIPYATSTNTLGEDAGLTYNSARGLTVTKHIHSNYPLSPRNLFGGNQWYSSDIHNIIYQAGARFVVTPTNFKNYDGSGPATTASINNLFTGSYEVYTVRTNAGETSTLSIELTGKGEFTSDGIVYSTGYLMVAFYGDWGEPQSISARFKDKNGAWTAGGTPVQITYPSSATDGAYWMIPCSLYNYLTEIELTVTAPATTNAHLAGLDYWCTRPASTPQLSLTKNYAQDLYMDWTWNNASNSPTITLEALTGNITGVGTGTFNIVKATGNGLIWSDGTTGTTPASGAGTRMMWIPAKSAFRAGTAVSTYWDDANIGTASFASGLGTKAGGTASFAAGNAGTASGSTSTITAGGTGSFAQGYINLSPGGNTGTISASTDGAFAQGFVQAVGGGVTASITASGIGSFAHGINGAGTSGNITASGVGSLAIGYATGGSSVTSTGITSVSIGLNTNATADYAWALGKSFTNATTNTFQVGFGQADLQVASGAISFPNNATLNTGSGSITTTGTVTGQYVTATSSGRTVTLDPVTNGLCNLASSGVIYIYPQSTLVGWFSSTQFGFYDDKDFQFGSGGNHHTTIRWGLAQTNDALMIGVDDYDGSSSRSIIVTGDSRRTTDYTHAVSAYPIMWFQDGSATIANWGSIGHNGTDFVFNAGAGKANFSALDITTTGTITANTASTIQDTAASSAPYLQFKNSGGTRKGYVGVASGGSSTVTLASDSGAVNIYSGQSVATTLGTSNGNSTLSSAKAIVFNLKDTSADTTAKVANFLSFSGANALDGADGSGRVGFFGYETSVDTNFAIANEIAGSILHIRAGGGIWSSGKGLTIGDASDLGTVTFDNTINSSIPQTSVNGLTGTAVWSMPFQGTSYKKFLVYLTNFTSAGSVITFPVAFSKTPYVYGDATATAIAVTTTTTTTLTSVGAVAGFIFIEGY